MRPSGYRKRLLKRGEPCNVNLVAIGLRWPLARIVSRPFHADHLVIGLPRAKRDDVISRAELPHTLTQKVEIWSRCARLNSFQFAIPPERKLNRHGNAIVPTHIERQFKGAGALG